VRTTYFLLSRALLRTTFGCTLSLLAPTKAQAKHMQARGINKAGTPHTQTQ
jgi:hypothetical protein